MPRKIGGKQKLVDQKFRFIKLQCTIGGKKTLMEDILNLVYFTHVAGCVQNFHCYRMTRYLKIDAMHFIHIP